MYLGKALFYKRVWECISISMKIYSTIFVELCMFKHVFRSMKYFLSYLLFRLIYSAGETRQAISNTTNWILTLLFITFFQPSNFHDFLLWKTYRSTLVQNYSCMHSSMSFFRKINRYVLEFISVYSQTVASNHYKRWE